MLKPLALAVVAAAFAAVVGVETALPGLGHTGHFAQAGVGAGIWGS